MSNKPNTTLYQKNFASKIGGQFAPVSGGQFNRYMHDIAKFEFFYNDIINWVKKNAGGHLKVSGDNLYYFKDAWTHHLNKK